MVRDLKASLIAAIAFTLVFGLAYPLLTTGVAQVLFGDQADGSRIERGGELVGSELIGQGFTERVAAHRGEDEFERAPVLPYFQSRPSATKYSADVTFFDNLGPNNGGLAELFRDNLEAYVELEGRYTPGLTAADVPVDAVTTSASGVDPHISEANAEIQANRVAEERGLPLEGVLELIDENTDGRALGVLGEPGVNVLELNLALDEEAGT